MAKGTILTNSDKDRIRIDLINACEGGWSEHGYKKTNIKYLSKEVGISVGTFYTLYPTKEDLFFETLAFIQRRLETNYLTIIENDPTKTGFAQGMKELYREYCKMRFLYNIPDFIAFVSKLPQESVQALAFDNEHFFDEMIDKAGLELKVDREIGFGVLSAMLSTIQTKDAFMEVSESQKIFDFMIDNLIEDIFK